MARRKSSGYVQVAQALSAPEMPLVLLKLSHALLPVPLCFVNDAQDVESNGVRFIAARFSWSWPDDHDKQTPRATISIANISREVSPFFERSHGARGAQVTLLQILRSNPDFVEDEIQLDLNNIVATPLTVSGQLGFDDILNKAGTPFTFRPETAPGLF